MKKTINTYSVWRHLFRMYHYVTVCCCVDRAASVWRHKTSNRAGEERPAVCCRTELHVDWQCAYGAQFNVRYGVIVRLSDHFVMSHIGMERRLTRDLLLAVQTGTAHAACDVGRHLENVARVMAVSGVVEIAGGLMVRTNQQTIQPTNQLTN
jgi:hypothetical protein